MHLVYFLGIDGSGKTTHAEASVKWLKERGVKATVIHFYKNPTVKFLSTIKRKITRKSYIYIDESKKAYSKHLQRDVPAWTGKYDKNTQFSRIRPYLTLLDNIVYALTHILLKIIQGYDVVICDRFLFDYFLKYKLIGYSVKGLETIYRRLIPKYGICFDVSPKETYSKRRDLEPLSFSYYVEARNIYHKIAEEHEFPILDTTEQPFDVVQNEVNRYFVRVLGVL